MVLLSSLSGQECAGAFRARYVMSFPKSVEADLDSVGALDLLRHTWAFASFYESTLQRILRGQYALVRMVN